MVNKFLLKNPIISEKSTAAASQRKYTFLVGSGVTSSEVSKTVEGIYKVHVIKANVVNTPAKPKRFGQHMSMESGYKKVIVTLKQGEKLDILQS